MRTAAARGWTDRMFDIDAGYAPIIRLDALREAIDANQAEAIAYREMTEATMRWIDARMKAQALRDQSRPVPASDAALSTDNDFWTHRHLSAS